MFYNPGSAPSPAGGRQLSRSSLGRKQAPMGMFILGLIAGSLATLVLLFGASIYAEKVFENWMMDDRKIGMLLGLLIFVALAAGIVGWFTSTAWSMRGAT
jgi:hypothetical protein